MKYKLIIAILVFLSFCKSKENHPGSHDLSFSVEDSSKYFLLKHNLYKDQFGNIAYKTIDRSDPENPIDRFITVVWHANLNDSIDGGKMEMKDVIDIISFEEIKGIYYRDKNHYYVYNQMSDGGTFAIIRDIDKKSFVVVSPFYAKDIHNAYHGAVKIENVDINTFRPLPGIKSGDSTWQYARDKDHFYYFGDIIKKEDHSIHGL